MKKELFDEFEFENFLGLVEGSKFRIRKLNKMTARDILNDLGWITNYRVSINFLARRKKILFFKESSKRLLRGAEFLNIPLPLLIRRRGIEFFRTCCEQVLERNNLPYSLLWIFLTGGFAGKRINPVGDGRIIILNSKFDFEGLRTLQTRGIRLKTVFLPVEGFLPFIAFNRCAWLRDLENFDDVLFVVNDNEEIIDTNEFGIFFINKDKKVITNTNSSNFFLKVAARIVIEILERLEEPFEIRKFSLAELKSADEVFVASTTLGVCPVVRIDDKSFRIGPRTCSIKRNYFYFIGSRLRIL